MTLFHPGKSIKTDVLNCRISTNALDIKRKGNVIIYAENLNDAWNVLKIVRTVFPNQDGTDSFLVTTPPNHDTSESATFLQKAWKQLFYFNVFIAYMSLDNSAALLYVAVDNPYFMSTEQSESSLRNFLFTGESSKTNWTILISYIDDRTKDLHGFPVKIVMQNFTGLSEATTDASGRLTFVGSEGDIVNEYVKFLNFTPIYSYPRDGIIYGGFMDNGSLTGGIRDVEDGIVEMFGNRRKLTGDAFNTSKFLRTVYQTSLVILLPKGLPQVNVIGTLFSVLDANVSIISLSFIVFIILSWTIVKINRAKVCTRTTITEALMQVIMDCICLMNNTSFQLPKCFSENIFYVSLTVWSMLITNIYIGTITTRLAVRESTEIETLEQLKDSGLMIGCMKDSCRDMDGGISDGGELTVRQILAQRLFLIYNPLVQNIPHRIAYDRDTCTICPLDVADSLVVDIVSADGKELLHVMREPVNTMYSSQLVRSGWPLLGRLEKIHDHLTEAGLLDFWEKRKKYEFTLKRIDRSYQDTSTHLALILTNFRFIFILWGVLLLASIITFILELFFHRIGKNLKTIHNVPRVVHFERYS